MDQASRDRARAAKDKLALAIRGSAEVVGVGLTRHGDAMAVKVNLARPAAPGSALPESFEGVPVVYEVVGRITPRAG